MMQKDVMERLIRIERICDAMRAERTDIITNAYEQAVAEQDEETAAELARKIRNKLLDDSDQYVTLDRLKLDTSSIARFLAGLRGIFEGTWSIYRQQLRDLTEQPGFPFEISWPQAPDGSNREEQGKA